MKIGSKKYLLTVVQYPFLKDILSQKMEPYNGDGGLSTTELVVEAEKADGDLMVRECVFRKFLTKPMTVKLLDASRDYWLNHGVSDWGMVIDEE